MEPITGTLIATGAQVAGQAANMAFSGNMNKKNRRHAALMQRRQFDFQREFWDAQNRYNLPIEQRKRLEEAGYNMALLYGKGQMPTPGNAQPPSGGSSGPGAGTSAPNIALQFDPLTLAQAEKIKAETNILDEQRNLIMSQLRS